MPLATDFIERKAPLDSQGQAGFIDSECGEGWTVYLSQP